MNGILELLRGLSPEAQRIFVEMAKVRLNGDDREARRQAQSVLVHVLEGTLRLLHPMMPFISEELWQQFPHRGEALIAAPWPEPDGGRLDDASEREMATVQEVVGAVRNIRGMMRVPPGRRADALLKVGSEGSRRVLESVRDYICDLARLEGIRIGMDLVRPPASASAVLTDVEIYVPLKGLIDLDVERQRLGKEIGRLEKALSGLEKKLANKGFLKNAPPEIVENERGRREEYRATLEKLKENRAALTS